MRLVNVKDVFRNILKAAVTVGCKSELVLTHIRIIYLNRDVAVVHGSYGVIVHVLIAYKCCV